ncbi:MAG: efflux RND transporter permease subunit [Chloroflexota bacterium]
MSLAELAVRHRVTVAMCVVIVVLLGMVSYGRIPIDLLPDLNFPVVAIITSYPGAAPQEVESLISRPLEEVIGTVANVKDVQSVSTEENSLVIAQFNWGTDMDFAALDIREKVDLVKRLFPTDVATPMVMKFDPSLMPVMVVSMTGGSDQVELRRTAEDVVKKALERVDGVASVQVVGGQEAQVRVTVDPDKLNKHNLAWQQVALAIQTASLNLPGGKISEDGKDFLIRSQGGVDGLAQLRDVIVGADMPATGGGLSGLSGISGLSGLSGISGLSGLGGAGGLPAGLTGQPAGQGETIPGTGLPGALPPEATDSAALPTSAGAGALTSGTAAGVPTLTAKPVYLKDIATVERVIGQASGVSRLNGEDSVSLIIQKSSQANTVKVANLVGAALADAKKQLPASTQIVTTMNQATFIGEAIGMVQSNAVQGGALAVLILFAFLRSIPSTLIIGLSIPVSIVFALTLMFFSKLTLNMMTLAGLALGIGMLVDNSIVVLENIFRRMEDGEPGISAAVSGTKEVAMAITASTLTTVAVFLPVVFVGGISGQLFGDLALTVTYSLLASLIVAMTLVPALAVTFYRNRPPKLKVEQGTLLAGYRRSLVWVLRHRVVVAGATLVLFGLSLAALPGIGREFIPDMDRGEFTISIDMPVGTSLAETDALVRQVEAAARKLPEIRYVTATVGSGGSVMSAGGGLFGGSADSGTITVKIAPQRDRRRTIGAVMADLRAETAPALAAAGATATFEQSGFIVGGMLNPVEVILKGADLEQLRGVALDLAEDMKTIPGLTNVQTDFRDGRPELQIIFDRRKLTENGLAALQAAQTVKAAFSGESAGSLLVDGERLDIRLEFPADRRDQVADLGELALVTPTGKTLKLKDVASITVGAGPETLRRQGGERTVSITAGLEDVSLNTAIADIQARIDARGLPAGVSVAYGGENKEMQDAFSGLTMALWLAVALVYAVMASQFENLLHPFIIMFTMPMAVIGIVAALYFGRLTLSIPSVIGVITLAGVVVNNGIVMIDFINQRRREGLERQAAVVSASVLRLRPILMTSLTTILGLLPMAFVRGEGTELTRPLGMVLMAGLLASTLLTLYVLPIVYLWIDGLFSRRRVDTPLATGDSND